MRGVARRSIEVFFETAMWSEDGFWWITHTEKNRTREKCMWTFDRFSLITSRICVHRIFPAAFVMARGQNMNRKPRKTEGKPGQGPKEWQLDRCSKHLRRLHFDGMPIALHNEWPLEGGPHVEERSKGMVCSKVNNPD
jgi:hypothetical protein